MPEEISTPSTLPSQNAAKTLLTELLRFKGDDLGSLFANPLPSTHSFDLGSRNDCRPTTKGIYPWFATIMGPLEADLGLRIELLE